MRIEPLRILCWISLLASALAPVAGADSPARPAKELRGRWVLDAGGNAVGPRSFRRGLQPSGILWRRGELWAIGDQRSEYPGHVFRLDPRTGRLLAPPSRLAVPEPREGEDAQLAAYRAIPNSDFEGLAAHPREPNVFYAVTEDKVPWIAEIHAAGAGGGPAFSIERLREVRFPKGLAPWRESANFRLEGLAVSDDAKTLYLAYERAADDLPRVLQAPLDKVQGSGPIELEDVPVDFGAVPRRADKPSALLNINDLVFLRSGGKAGLVAIARDQERLLWIDLAARRVERWIDLDLRGPDGEAVFWVSPEGLAAGGERGPLWIINDPDSVRGNYRRSDEAEASGRYAEFVPLLFELRLDDLFED